MRPIDFKFSPKTRWSHKNWSRNSHLRVQGSVCRPGIIPVDNFSWILFSWRDWKFSWIFSTWKCFPIIWNFFQCIFGIISFYSIDILILNAFNPFSGYPRFFQKGMVTFFIIQWRKKFNFKWKILLLIRYLFQRFFWLIFSFCGIIYNIHNLLNFPEIQTCF